MATLLARGGAAAVGVASLALGCVSTKDGLFSEYTPTEPVSGEVAAPPMAMTPAAQPAAVPGATVPEQLLGGQRGDLPVEPEVSGAPLPGEAPVPPAPEPEDVAMPTDPCASENSIVCDTFEDELEGAFPQGASWLPELTGCGSHVIDGAGPSSSGTKALRGDDGGYPECMLHAQLTGERDVYVRTRVFLDGTGDVFSEDVSLLEFGARAAQDDPELRVGVRQAEGNGACQGSPGVEVNGSGLTSGAGTSCTGFTLAPSRWYCLEVHLVRSETTLSLSVAIDGSEVLARDFAGTADWFGDDLFVKLGRASYGASGLASVWHDDVAISREPVPCLP